jgi:hypothetical protein
LWLFWSSLALCFRVETRDIVMQTRNRPKFGISTILRPCGVHYKHIPHVAERSTWSMVTLWSVFAGFCLLGIAA